MPPITGTDELTGPFNTSFDQIREGFRTVIESFNEIISTVNDWAWVLGGAVGLWIAHSLDAVGDALNKFKEKLDYAFDHQFPVLSLINNSFYWLDEVKTPVSELSFVTTDPRDENMTKWTGDAATSYNNKAVKQKAAVDEAVLKSEFISQWLFKIAKSNVDFVVAISKIVTSLVKEFIKAAAETEDVINIPWALDTLADAAGGLAKDLLDLVVQLGQRFVEALGNVRDIATQVGDHSKLPGGNWPEAVRG
jgi:hypothetical protein